MAGSTGAGFTHFNKISGKNGVFTGTAGNEVRIDTGNQTYAVTIDSIASSTAVGGAYIVVPYNVNLVAAYGAICAGTTGTGATITITANDTAGAALFGSASFASAGTAGVGTITFGTMSTAVVAAGSIIAVTQASCATAYGVTVTIAATRASSTA